MTYIYVFMQVSKRTYDEIKKKLLDAGYDHALHHDTERGEVLDMHGIALAKLDKGEK